MPARPSRTSSRRRRRWPSGRRPSGRRATRRTPSNTWILGRNLQKIGAFFHEGPRALAGFWDARIFHPAPLTLAYSEHLLAETVQALPLYALFHNEVLCYNVLLLLTFVLSGFFAYL